MKIVYGAEEARRGPLRRVTLEQMEVPLAVQDRLREAFGRDLTPAEAVTTILRAVKVLGDEALRDYTRRLDGVEIGEIEVSPLEWEEGCSSVPPTDLAAIRQAVERVGRFHRRQRQAWSDWSEGGLTQRLVPLGRVGCYVPAGSAPLPSTVVMTAIPAREAGVDQVVVASPPRKDGRVAPVILAACRLAGVDRVFRMGGAQALAALAYGTASVPRVDKIVGPGNLFVTLAKKMLFGEVGVDGLPGPTESLLLADGEANPVLCAADLLAQAEHDVLASALLITDSETLARDVSAEVERQLRTLERRPIAAASLDLRGGIVVVPDWDEGVELANEYAPEHLCLLTREPERLLPRLRNAGGIFVGEGSFEVLGDYLAGPSHVMPTGGTARFNSALHVGDFLRVVTTVALGSDALPEIGPAAATLARAEGLTAHARAVELRLERLASVRARDSNVSPLAG